jgi:hypothetical protein
VSLFPIPTKPQKKEKERKRKNQIKMSPTLMLDIFWLVFLGRYLRIFIGDVY